MAAPITTATVPRRFLPPVLDGILVLGVLPTLARDTLPVFERARALGDVVRLPPCPAGTLSSCSPTPPISVRCCRRTTAITGAPRFMTG